MGAARVDISPPVGIFARSWGASTEDVSSGNHRPLIVTALVLRATSSGEPTLIIISADLCSFKSLEDEWFLREPILSEFSLPVANVVLNLSHTHSQPSLHPGDQGRPGGHLIVAYRTQVRESVLACVRKAMSCLERGNLIWDSGHCNLARNRDMPYRDGQVLCGFNPASTADDTLLVGRVTALSGRPIATIVNYACHPTTLAWQNKQISPDYIGAMREIVEASTDGAPCLFLQGASGELAPREQYTGDVKLADKNGRQLGYAVLSTLTGMLPPGRQITFGGPVESGAVLATWNYADHTPATILQAAVFNVKQPLKPDFPDLDEIDRQMRATTDPIVIERLARRRRIRRQLGSGSISVRKMWVWRIGDVFVVGQSDETYSDFQRSLRSHFPAVTIVVMNLVNGNCGYQPPAEVYESNVYQAWQTPFAPGCLERSVDAAVRALQSLGAR